MNGSLVYRATGENAGSLLYRKSGEKVGHLVYRSDGRDDICTIRVPWKPQHYTCDTYHQYHEAEATIDGQVTSGSLELVSHTVGTTEDVFEVRVLAGPAVFTLSLSADFNCASDEPGDLTCDVFATMRRGEPKMKRDCACPRSQTPNTVQVLFNAAVLLEGIA